MTFEHIVNFETEMCWCGDANHVNGLKSKTNTIIYIRNLRMNIRQIYRQWRIKFEHHLTGQ